MTRFSRHLISGMTVGLLCLCGVLPARAQDIFLRPAMESFVDKDTGLEFPAIVDTFQKVRVRKNENPVFGTVVRYENEAGTCADVYIYSLDTGAKAVRQDMFEKHCKETDEGILNMPANNRNIKSVKHIEAPGRKAPETGFEAHYSIQNGTVQMDSFLYLALYRGKLVKVRVTYFPEDADEIQHACLFVDAVSAMLNRNSKAEDTRKPASDTPQEKKPDTAPREPPKTEAPASATAETEAKTGA